MNTNRLPSNAFCVSIPTVLAMPNGDLETFDFIDAADFHAAAINWELEAPERAEDEFEAEYNAFIDTLEAVDNMMEKMENAY